MSSASSPPRAAGGPGPLHHSNSRPFNTKPSPWQPLRHGKRARSGAGANNNNNNNQQQLQQSNTVRSSIGHGAAGGPSGHSSSALPQIPASAVPAPRGPDESRRSTSHGGATTTTTTTSDNNTHAASPESAFWASWHPREEATTLKGLAEAAEASGFAVADEVAYNSRRRSGDQQRRQPETKPAASSAETLERRYNSIILQRRRSSSNASSGHSSGLRRRSSNASSGYSSGRRGRRPSSMVDAVPDSDDDSTSSTEDNSDGAVDGDDEKDENDRKNMNIASRTRGRPSSPSSTEREFERITRKLDAAVEARLAAADDEDGEENNIASSRASSIPTPSSTERAVELITRKLDEVEARLAVGVDPEDGVKRNSRSSRASSIFAPSSTERKVERITRKLDQVEARLAVAETVARKAVEKGEALALRTVLSTHGSSQGYEEDHHNSEEEEVVSIVTPISTSSDEKYTPLTTSSNSTRCFDNKGGEAAQQISRNVVLRTRLERSRQRVREHENIVAKMSHDQDEDQGEAEAFQPFVTCAESNAAVDGDNDDSNDAGSISLDNIAEPLSTFALDNDEQEQAEMIASGSRLIETHNASKGDNSSSSLSGYVVVKRSKGSSNEFKPDRGVAEQREWRKKKKKIKRRSLLKVETDTADDYGDEVPSDSGKLLSSGCYLQFSPTHQEAYERIYPVCITYDKNDGNMGTFTVHPGELPKPETPQFASAQRTKNTMAEDERDGSPDNVLSHRRFSPLRGNRRFFSHNRDPTSAPNEIVDNTSHRAGRNIFNRVKGRGRKGVGVDMDGLIGGYEGFGGDDHTLDMATIVSQADTVQVSNCNAANASMKLTLPLKPPVPEIQRGVDASKRHDKSTSGGGKSMDNSSPTRRRRSGSLTNERIERKPAAYAPTASDILAASTMTELKKTRSLRGDEEFADNVKMNDGGGDGMRRVKSVGRGMDRSGSRGRRHTSVSITNHGRRSTSIK